MVTMRWMMMKRRTCGAALPTMTSGNKEEADVQGRGKKEDFCVDTRRITSRRRRRSGCDKEEDA